MGRLRGRNCTGKKFALADLCSLLCCARQRLGGGPTQPGNCILCATAIKTARTPRAQLLPIHLHTTLPPTNAPPAGGTQPTAATTAHRTTPRHTCPPPHLLCRAEPPFPLLQLNYSALIRPALGRVVDLLPLGIDIPLDDAPRLGRNLPGCCRTGCGSCPCGSCSIRFAGGHQGGGGRGGRRGSDDGGVRGGGPGVIPIIE